MDQYEAGVDPYFDSTNGVLRNLLGIDDPKELERIEAEVTSREIASLAEEPVEGSFILNI